MSSSNDDPAPNSTTRKRTGPIAVTKATLNEEPREHAAAAATPNSNAIPNHRKKRHVSRSETPKWQTVLSVVTKLCLLVVGLFWFFQMISKLGTGDSLVNYPLMDFDSKISKFERFVKENMKTLQSQVNAVDKKVSIKVDSLYKELNEKIEEKSLAWEKEMKKLEWKSEDMSKSIGMLKNMDFLTKDEFESFKSELLKKTGKYMNDASLDEIGALAKEIVEKEIERHAADGIGRVDYALGAGGARVIMHSEPYVNGKLGNWFERSSRVHSNAKKMLEPSFGEPGQCFALKGSSGYVDIRLRVGIVLEAVTLEHVSKSVAYDRSSAPKDCIISALFKEAEDSEYAAKVLTKFSYDIEKSNIQTFNIENSSIGVVNMVRFEFASNHGNPSLTCIYRFRVHGYENKTVKSENESMG